MVSASKDPLTFNDLMATPINFSKYVLNGLKIENLTQDILLGLAFNLLKGTCSSNIELEYNFQECFNALTDKLDWNNTEGDRYPFDLSKPLPLQCPPDYRTVAADYFFNNDLEYLKTSDVEVTYTTSITKTKAARYEIKGIEDMLYKFKEGDFVDLHLNDIKDMLLLVVQHKFFYLDGDVIVNFIMALRMFTRSLILKRRVEDLQLGVERIIYEDLDKQKRVLRADELYKYSDGTLKSVRDEIHHRVLDFHLDYNPEIPKRKWTAIDRKRAGLMIELIDKQLREMDIIINLERLVGARELEMDYKLMTRTKKLYITKPQKTFPDIEFKEPYTSSYDPPGIVYEDLDKQKRVLRADELYKFSDGTLKSVLDEIHHRVLDFRLDYNLRDAKEK
ncbi:hypothetical protein Tco_1393699 [Tanacetum coccineum]